VAMIRQRLRKDLHWGLGWAWGFAAACSAWVLVMSIFRRSLEWSEYNTTTFAIVGTYAVAGTGAGVLLGVLRPLTTRRWGAFLVGWLVGTLVYASVMVPMGLGREAPWWLALVPGLLVGGGLAVVWYDEG